MPATAWDVIKGWKDRTCFLHPDVSPEVLRLSCPFLTQAQSEELAANVNKIAREDRLDLLRLN